MTIWDTSNSHVAKMAPRAILKANACVIASNLAEMFTLDKM